MADDQYNTYFLTVAYAFWTGNRIKRFNIDAFVYIYSMLKKQEL